MVWRALGRTSFAVISHVNAAGEPGSRDIVYAIVDQRCSSPSPPTVEGAAIATGQEVAVTVPVRRGGILALVVPIPPATITFHARATVHASGSFDVGSVSKELKSILPDDRQATSCVLELVPEGRFVTYGIGVSLMAMRDPHVALAHVPVA